jgi:hypothetical protein
MVDQIDVPKQEAQAAKEGWFHRSLVGLDQFVNVVTGGKPDETISARAYRASLRGNFFGKVLNAGLNLIQRNHGADAAAGDLERSEAVEKIEEDTLNAR